MRILKRIMAGFGLFILIAYIGMIAYAYWPTGIEEVPAQTLAGPDDRFIDVNGLELRYRTYGEAAPDKPNLVLIHGFGNSLQSFRLLAPLLQNDFYVVTVDLPGFGLSTKPVDYEYRNANQARTIGAFIRVLGLKKAVIGGHSLGGAIAVHVAVHEPGINGLLLINPGIITTGVPAITQYLPFPFQRLSAKQFGHHAKRFDIFVHQLLHPGHEPGTAVRTQDNACVAAPPVFRTPRPDGHSAPRNHGNRSSGTLISLLQGPTTVLPSSPRQVPGGKTTARFLAPFSRTGATRTFSPSRNWSLTPW